MESFVVMIREWFGEQGLAVEYASWAATAVGVVALGLIAWIANFVAKKVILRVVSLVVKRTSFQWDDVMLECGVFTRLSHVAPAMAINAFGPDVLGHSPEVLANVHAAVNIYLTFIWVVVLFAVLDAVQKLCEQAGHGERMPVKGFVQAVKLVASLLALILVMATVLDKSPFYLLSGLGALTAVLLLVFKDAILGFVAGIMISVNQMVRIGDWIEMSKAGADGFVIDVSLTTVKVQNWDRTITTIPTYTLISDSFKNWRGMFESGGRRIKRALHIDMRTVRFADEALLAKWRRMDLLKEYLASKQAEIDADNAKKGTDLSILGNGRRISNLGTFRAYCIAYLKAHPQIHQDMTFLVRQLAPTEHGMPIEIYVFTKDTRWAFYEGIQADVFDHLIAVCGEFGLKVFQSPSGSDVQDALGQMMAARAAEAEKMLSS
jgi:miniconductance mechanosensitive channel